VEKSEFNKTVHASSLYILPNHHLHYESNAGITVNIKLGEPLINYTRYVDN